MLSERRPEGSCAVDRLLVNTRSILPAKSTICRFHLRSNANSNSRSASPSMVGRIASFSSHSFGILNSPQKAPVTRRAISEHNPVHWAAIERPLADKLVALGPWRWVQGLFS